jgi:hypothetical protein
MAAQDRHLPFTTRQLAIIVGMGVVVWFVGALVCRWIGDSGWYAGTARWIVYAALIPGTLPVLLLLRALAGLRSDQMALASAIATAAAITLDSVAMVLVPELYAANSNNLASAGASILWGGAVAIFLGCWLNRVQPSA